MDMASIDIITRSLTNTLLLVLALSIANEALAINWIIRPSLNVEEIYSDNINQDANNQRGALVTEVSPSVSIRSTSSINSFDLNYRMQNLYNAGGNSGVDINNQLQMNSKYQFVRNSLYLDSSSSISQQNVSNRRIASDNITGNSNNSTVTTFSISPYWTPHFKSFADGVVRATYNRVATSGGNNSLSDTNTLSQNIRLNSGRDFSRFTWSLAFNNSEQFRNDGENVKFQDSSAQIRTFWNRELSAFLRVGHSKNQFQTTTDTNNNGFFYTAGAQWRPSARFSVEAGYGNNAFVTVNISPIRRITWSTTYSNNDVGTNTGDRWQSSLSYNTRRSIWTFNYSEDTVTTQQRLLEQQIFNNQNDFGEDILDPEAENFAPNLPNLTDEVFVTKRADLSVSFRTGKSNFNLNGYQEKREFEQSQNSEDVYGVSGSWGWNFTRRTNSNIRLLWQTTEGQNATADERFEALISITRNIHNYLNGKVEYRFTDQSSDLADNGFTENRISASLNIRF
jgi:hypothetical protein